MTGSGDFHKRTAGTNGASRTITSIPLTDADSVAGGGAASVGALVRDATTQLSTLFRAEVALAKAEVTGEVKKGIQGSLFFVLALAVLIFSAFFFFFFLAELLDVWLYRWAAFLVVFAIMVAIAGLLALFGYLRVRRLRMPEKTIDSLRATAGVIPGTGGSTTPALTRGESL